jgi:hypothetical protein
MIHFDDPRDLDPLDRYSQTITGILENASYSSVYVFSAARAPCMKYHSNCPPFALIKNMPSSENFSCGAKADVDHREADGT